MNNELFLKVYGDIKKVNKLDNKTIEQRIVKFNEEYGELYEALTTKDDIDNVFEEMADTLQVFLSIVCSTGDALNHNFTPVLKISNDYKFNSFMNYGDNFNISYGRFNAELCKMLGLSHKKFSLKTLEITIYSTFNLMLNLFESIIIGLQLDYNPNKILHDIELKNIKWESKIHEYQKNMLDLGVKSKEVLDSKSIIGEDSFINGNNLEFKDISSEINREYFKYNKSYKIEGRPLKLNVSKSGGHRIFTDNGTSYYIQPKEGWGVKWNVDNNKPNFNV